MGQNERNESPRSKAAQTLGWLDERTRAVTPTIHPSRDLLADLDAALGAD
jgi:hypothetical protein